MVAGEFATSVNSSVTSRQIAPYCWKCRGNLADMQRGNNSAGDGNQDDRPPGWIRYFHMFFRCRWYSVSFLMF